MPIVTYPPAETPIVQFTDVSKSYGSIQAVQKLSFELNQGSVLGLLGPNGAGKSTVLRMIMSIIYPSTGIIKVFGGSALSNKDAIGYLPEERGLYKNMQVSTFLSYIGQLKGMRPNLARSRVSELLQLINLPEVGAKKCGELSKGMQQKIQFAAAIINQPALVILDEPFTGLDPVSAQTIQRLIFDLKEKGVTVILSTHLLHQADLFCDRFVMINKGIKVLDATMSEIRGQFSPQTIMVEPITRKSFNIEMLSLNIGVTAGHWLEGVGKLQVELAPDADPQTVMQAIIGHFPVRSIEMHRITLEDVFLRLVAGSNRTGSYELPITHSALANK